MINYALYKGFKIDCSNGKFTLRLDTQSVVSDDLTAIKEFIDLM